MEEIIAEQLSYIRTITRAKHNFYMILDLELLTKRHLFFSPLYPLYFLFQFHV